MSLVLDPRAIEVAADAAEQVLGTDHPLAAAIRDLKRDPDNAAAVYAAIESLPEAPRRALAAMVAETLMPALSPPQPTRH